MGVRYSCSTAAVKAEADSDGIIHKGHLLFIQPAHMLAQPLFVNGTDLLQQDY